MNYKAIIPAIAILQACSASDDNIADNKIRLKAVEDAAISYGAQSALAWQSKRINEQLSLKQESLARIFDFKRIMLPHNVLPPVIREASNSLNVDNSKTLRAADKTIEIVQDAKFVTTPPSWRDYLVMNYAMPDKPVTQMLPKSSDERKIWDRNIAKGWQVGYKQANSILRERLGKLTQDYSGMALFKKLYSLHMVTAPQVAMANLGITGDHRKLNIGDRIIRITGESGLLPYRSNSWNPGLTVKLNQHQGNIGHDKK